MKKNEEKLLAMRHSAEHILTMAMEKIFGSDSKGQPIIIKAMGPATKDGFYFDFDISEQARKDGFKLTESNFPKIEKVMRKLINQNLLMERVEVSVDVARKVFANNPYKLEFLDEIAKHGSVKVLDEIEAEGKQIKHQVLEKQSDKAVLYLTGNKGQVKADKEMLSGLAMMTNSQVAEVRLQSYVDLCSGPHVEKSSEIKVIKLLSIAGAYWRGDEKNKMLTRVYGTAFFKQEELDDFLEKKRLAEENNHRKIGKEMELFAIIPEIGQGLPVWLPNGYAMRRSLEDYMINLERRFGYQHILTPNINRKELFETSGHLGFYDESMYPPLVYEDDSDSESKEDETYYLKPMNCPAGMMVYKLKPHSYRELPMKMGEFGTVYRREKSGELHGLQRVRGFTQNDAHIFCTADQLKSQFKEVMEMLEIFYEDVGFDSYKFKLAISDPDKKKFQACGSREDWEKTENIMREILEEAGVEYVEDKGDAAFYGPKLDVQAVNVFGKEDTISTIQVDFNLPERFDLSYVAEGGEKERPFVIHRALIGSFERFFSFLIEHHGGDFPIWFAPVQVKILPIADRHHDYARKVEKELLKLGLRVQFDGRSERLQAKIRDAEVEKVPVTMVIGDNEVESEKMTLRTRGKAKNLVKDKEINLKDLKTWVKLFEK